ncbi:E3 ubiquitin-protein ligase SIAH1A-like isoform X2 [Bacillus rossius redtenbacheri]|uniref:E3 ubiquitin-protein ligase SIAH1A-like isoform X2 n=1 Tax=Bacillus rossius redtenbacheri TaxID=93214 RepID=UPI002FDE9815
MFWQSSYEGSVTPLEFYNSAMATEGSSELLESTGSAFDFNDSLLSLLECPVCTEYMRSPIKQCVNGHALCSLCKRKVSKCPTCQGSFLDTRNLPLENLAEKMLYPCENVLAGCGRRLAFGEVSEHGRSCAYRLYECLPGRDEGCKWAGRRGEILAHVETEHDGYAWMKEEVNTLYYDTFDFCATSNFSQVINIHDEIFWFHDRLNAETKKYYIAVQYIGPVENRLNFTYKVEFVSECKNYEFVFKCITHSDTDDVNDIFESETCAVINYNIIEVYLKEKSLAYNLSVMKCSQ